MEKLITVFIIGIFIFCGSIQNSSAKIITANVEYKSRDKIMEGYIAYDDAAGKKRPAVIIVHEWNGLGDYVKNRAEQIAQLGYVAFAADIYGKGVRAKTMEESGKLAGIYRSDRKLMRERINAALAEIKKNKLTDAKNIAAMGYCFGGGVVLELARSGADIKGAISFHGNLDSLSISDAKNIKAKVFAFHGADDPFVTPDIVAAFEKEMKSADIDWQLVIYGGAVHGFTNPANGNNPKKGLAYNKKADKRSWEAMKIFLKEIFQ